MAQNLLVKNKMEVIKEMREEDCKLIWKKEVSEKLMKEKEVKSYQSFKDQDLSMEAVRGSYRTEIITNRKFDDDNHQYDDADDSGSYTSSTGTSSSDSDDNDDNESFDELNTSLTSSLEVKFEKEVDLFAENYSLDSSTDRASILSDYFHGEINNGMLSGPMSPVSKNPQNGIFTNGDVNMPMSPVSDNRVFVLDVKQAVIETKNIEGTCEPLTCEITDLGPEIKKVILLETDIDSVAENEAEDKADYKVVGSYHEVSKRSSGESNGVLENSNEVKVSYLEAHYSKVESDMNAENEKNIFGKKNKSFENKKDQGLKTIDKEIEKMNKKNSAIIEAQTGKGLTCESTKTQENSANGDTTGAYKTQAVVVKRNSNLSGLKIDQYKIIEKTEIPVIKTSKKNDSVAIVQDMNKEENKTGIKETEIMADVQGSGDTRSEIATKTEHISAQCKREIVNENEIALRETKGRAMSKVKRELKLDLPNDNNNKTALLDQLLLSSDMSQGIGVCCRCGEGFGTHQQIVNSNGEVWHPQCFVCAQCFQPFPDGVFYEYEGRKYCEHDFHVLFAPCCGKCNEFVVGRVIKAMNNAWHPDCFRCQLCTGPLADAGFVKNAGRALCRECNAKEKARGLGKYVCHKCHSIIEEGHIKYKGEAYHPYHFNCKNCGIELNSDAREVNEELYCLRCHDKMGIPICGACRRPIEERVVHALGKAWHVEHFVCAKCEKPFFGTRHYEKKGLAYCEVHYHQLFGNICFVCNTVISGDVFHAFNKAWHVKCFACSICDRKMSQKTKFFEFDLKPVCKFCYEKFPGELKKRLKKAYEEQGTKK